MGASLALGCLALLEAIEDGDWMPFDPQQVSMETCRALSGVRSAFNRTGAKRTGFTLAHFAQAFEGLTYSWSRLGTSSRCMAPVLAGMLVRRPEGSLLL